MEPNTQNETVAEKPSSLIAKIIKWAILGLLLFTCFMAAYRKFAS
jgi:hypothetical protein